ncbi:hypothetical protein [uncultured Tateyamaria sp.]|uniref:hypothetical protein n=1 Tax=uncultured Tateyamaria sp. TaxID=455651 RepID=UPI002628979A|nr:hypothetical protein [uncultured Tateyamaria sp.]
MSQDFKDRLARLEAKKTAAAPPPSSSPSGRKRPDRNPRGGGLKLILLGVAVLVGLPTATFVGTMTYTKNKHVIDNVIFGAKAMAVAYAPAINDPERRAARRENESVMLRFNMGTLSEEEGRYWASDEGQRRMVENQKKAMNFEGLEALAEKHFVKD